MWISHFIIKHLKIDEFTLQNWITLKMIAILKLDSFFYSLFETSNVSVISLTAEKAMPKYINPTSKLIKFRHN